MILSFKGKSDLLFRICVIAAAVLTTSTSYAGFSAQSTSDDSVTEAQASARDATSLSAREQEILSQFHEPAEARGTSEQSFSGLIRKQTEHFAKGQSIPKNLLAKALAYYHENYNSISNRTYLAVVDLSAASSSKRLHILNMKTGAVVHLHVAHGSGSDPNNDGYASLFGNTFNSEMSSLGFYRTAEIYQGVHGRSLRLDGLSSTNSNVRERAVVIHGADYVREANVKAGRSWGCFAVAMGQRNKVIDLLKGGAIIYAGLSR